LTAIVGFVEGGNAFLGADSQGTAGNYKVIRTDKKVFRRGDFLIGFTDSYRMGQVIQYQLEVPVQKDGISDHEYMCTVFIDACRKCLMENGIAKSENEVESCGTFLCAYKGKLYRIDDDYHVGQSMDNYDSVGCGRDLALGAFHAMSYLQISVEDRLETALEAAAKFSSGVGPPFHYISSQEETEKVEEETQDGE
jgi:ATP-dependent protease HslVU (ClpYQ) peptidase subunit